MGWISGVFLGKYIAHFHADSPRSDAASWAPPDTAFVTAAFVSHPARETKCVTNA